MTLCKKEKLLAWNYRIKERVYEMDEESLETYIKAMKRIFGEDYNPNLEPEITYEVIEVYYDENGNISAWSQDSMTPWRNF